MQARGTPGMASWIGRARMGSRQAKLYPALFRFCRPLKNPFSGEHVMPVCASPVM